MIQHEQNHVLSQVDVNVKFHVLAHMKLYRGFKINLRSCIFEMCPIGIVTL